MSKVYILTDSENRITRLDGGYSISNVDTSTWTLIDEGTGDKYNLCQSHYLDKPLMTIDGIYQYKYVDGVITERTAEEIEADRASQPQPEPTEESIYDLCVELINKGKTDGLQNKFDVYLAYNRLTAKEYETLMNMLKETEV